MSSVLNYFPKVTSDSNSLVVRLKNEGISEKEIQEKLIKFVLQALVNEDSMQVGRGAFVLCQNYKLVLDYKFSLYDIAILGIAMEVINYSFNFVGLTEIPSLPIDIEEELKNNRPTRNVIKKEKGSSDFSKTFKTEKELAEEAVDGCGGACNI